MILSHQALLYIATPTKVGTHSLEAVAARPRNRQAMELVGPTHGDRRRRMHRMAPDPAWRSYRAVLLVRNPWSRWVSVYEYLRAPKFYAQWGARAVQGTNWGGTNPKVRAELGPPMSFETFLSWLVDQRAEHYSPAALAKRGPTTKSQAYRSPWVWLDPLTTSVNLLNHSSGSPARPTLLHLEHLGQELPELFEKVPGLDLHVDQLNRTTDPTHPSWVDYWTPGARRLAESLGVAREAVELGYPSQPEERA